MGIIKSSKMTLLTTLAALIIIVNCIEEDLENDYQSDLRPRIMETRKATYDESWPGREDSMLPRTDDWKEVSPDEPLKRRRPGRKRKRRPQPAPVEDLVPQEAMSYPDEPPRPYHDFDSEKNLELTEKPKIRRRKPEQRPIRWTDDDVPPVVRPLRRRLGPRKHRPSLQESPEISEFRQVADINQDASYAKTESEDKVRQDVDQTGNVDDYTPDTKEDTIPNKKSENSFKSKIPVNEPVNSEQITITQISDDKSVSEFSMESLSNLGPATPKYKFPRRHKSRTSSVLSGPDKEQETIDPATLKDILKKSNGSSLSEILQQHNLSLTDLLHGKEHAVSIFKRQESTDDQGQNLSEIKHTTSDKKNSTNTDIKEESQESKPVNSETTYQSTEPVSDIITEYSITTDSAQPEVVNETEAEIDSTTTSKPTVESVTIIRRRFPITLRKKLRMRPALNVSTTQKAQLSRDVIALNRKYAQLRRNTTKAKEWKDIVTNLRQNRHDVSNVTKIGAETTTILTTPEDTTISATDFENNDGFLEEVPRQTNLGRDLADIDMDTTTIILSAPEVITEIVKNITEKPIGVVTMARPTAISLGLRRTALNNRLKRKRLKQKNSTTEPPQDDILKHLYGLGNLVSSSEFIAKTQPPRTTVEDSKYLTTLEDFMTTETTIRYTTTDEPVPVETIPTTDMMPTSLAKTTTEESAKIEIEEVLNDTQILSKLSRILMERNMTLEELVALRERGSSRIHLKDIFHNASQESNPPEPFLTKSVIEPISKETYPLRALLDANSHDPNCKETIDDPEINKNIDVPIAMDYGNNVNENAENMGIMSLFNNYTKDITKIMLSPTSGDIDERILDITPNITERKNNTVRESRVIDDIEDDDAVNWNDILALMGAPKINKTEEIPTETPFKKITLDDIDTDGLMMLEDLQRLKDLDNHIGAELTGNIALDFGNIDPEPQEKGFLDNISSQTTSVTVATASIVGLGMVLFLLTYVAFKWKQQRSTGRKKSSFSEERISTPVFENRKGLRHNNSMRSISPIMPGSHMYTVNSLDSHTGEESGEYMWDSMRQPYQ